MPNTFEICDDYGVWVVVPCAGGRWATEQLAKAECNRRNFEDGCADKKGELLHLYNQLDWWERHSKRPDCTCKILLAPFAQSGAA
jgi:hypothetical protein